MICETLAKLKKEYEEAGADFDLKRNSLQSRIGVSQKDEYDRLSSAVDAAWSALPHARSKLDIHIRQHRCQAASSVSRTV